PRNLHVVLVGSPSGGRTMQDVKDEARLFGVRQDLVFFEALPITQVNELQARARTAVIFSAREGACVAITESMFANTPVGAMRDAHVGAVRHINNVTGVLFSRRNLYRQLGNFLDNAEAFEPRKWAVTHISCHQSSKLLNDVL